MRRLRCEGCATTDSAKACDVDGKTLTLCRRCYCERTGDAEVPRSVCPGCGKASDMATHAGSERVVPEEGDASICIYCATVRVFDKRLRLVPITQERLDALTNQERIEISQAQWAIRKMNAN